MISSIITLQTAGIDTGPFNLYSDVDGFTSAFETNIDIALLLAGYVSYVIPDGTTTVRIMSNSALCTNYIDVTLIEVVESCGFTWMLKNLDVSTFRNGDAIPQITDNAEWVTAGDNGQPAWCYYNDDPLNGPIYGKLYNWHAVNDPRGIAPSGFHVPTEAEWDAYITCIGGFAVAGGKMKEAGLAHWLPPNTATNSEGWTGLPGGNRGNVDGAFQTLGTVGYFWSSTVGPIVPPFLVPTRAWRYALFNSLTINKNSSAMQYGFSVRCLKD